MKKNRIKRLFSLSACLVLSSVFISLSASADQTSPPAVESVDLYGGLGLPTDTIPFMRKVRRGTLPNGLRYYILKNDKPKKMAYLALVVRVGSILEEDNEQGLAHFVEHMAFQGTKRFPKKGDILDYFRSKGMRFGPNENAWTYFNETVYEIKIPVEVDAKGMKRIPRKALDVIDDWTHAITFDPKNISDEKLVILEEKRLRMANADGRVMEKLFSIVYKGSKYAVRWPIGCSEIIENANQKSIKDFYDKWYRPENMAVILVGDFDDDALEKSLACYFHAAPSKTLVERPEYELPLPIKGNKNIEIITDPELSNASVFLIYNQFINVWDNSLSSFREQLIDSLILIMTTYRFQKMLHNPDTPCIHACVETDRLKASSTSRLIQLIAKAKTNKSEEAIKFLLREKESICRYGWTKSEVDVAKRALLAASASLAAEKRHGSRGYVSNFKKHFTGFYNCVADYDTMLNAAEKILPNISVKELHETVKKHLAEDDLTVIVVAPEKEKIPSKDAIKKIIETSKNMKISPPKEETTDDILLNKPPTLGKILTENTDAKTNTITWTLSNGATVVLKKTDNKANEIVVEALAKGGILNVPSKNIVSAKLATGMFNVSGVGKYSRNELLRKLANKYVGLDFAIYDFTHGFSGHSANKDIRTLFELLYLTFTEPRFDSKAIKAHTSKYKSVLENEDQEPKTVFQKAFVKIIYGNDPYFKPLEFSDLADLDKSVALDFVKKALNPADYTFVFVGSINDVNAFKEYAVTYLASIPAGKEKSFLPRHNINRPGEVKHNVYKGDEESSIINMLWAVKEQYSQKGEAIADVLREYLDIILIEHIRMKLGNAYAIGSSSGLDVLLEELRLGVSFACAPSKVDESVSEIMKILKSMDLGDINLDILDQAKKACNKIDEHSIQSNSVLASRYAKLAVVHGKPLACLGEFSKPYDSVSSKDLQEMVNKLLKGGCTQVGLYPEKLKKQ